LQDVEIDALGNVYARRPGGPEKPTLVTAHTDTVFPKTTDLTVRKEGDRVYGPGLGDNSLGVAGLFALVEALNASQTKTPGDLWLAANVGEEGLGDLRGMRAVMDRFGQAVRATVVIEGMSYGHVYHQAIGVHRLRLTMTGQGGHSWHDYGQASAIHGLVQLANQIVALQPATYPRTTLNIGEIRGGTSVNTIAREASLELDLRSEDPTTLAALVAEVTGLLEQFKMKDLTLTTTITSQRPAGSIAMDHPLLLLAAQSLRELGVDPVYEKGSTDCNIPLSRGYPATVIGLCHGGNAHRPDEYIEPALLENGLRHVVRVVMGTYEL
jgi:acetylornithine deacetylase/succinyl-diaminopimelate desuccinylase-like protein